MFAQLANAELGQSNVVVFRAPIRGAKVTV